MVGGWFSLAPTPNAGYSNRVKPRPLAKTFVKLISKHPMKLAIAFWCGLIGILGEDASQEMLSYAVGGMLVTVIFFSFWPRGGKNL